MKSFSERLAAHVAELDKQKLDEKTWSLKLASDSPLAPIAKSMTTGRGASIFQNLVTYLKNTHKDLTNEQIVLAVKSVLDGTAPEAQEATESAEDGMSIVKRLIG